jgi:hypothetical protein
MRYLDAYSNEVKKWKCILQSSFVQNWKYPSEVLCGFPNALGKPKDDLVCTAL